MESLLKQEESRCLKVVLIGPESTGKTTLAKQLAKHYNTQWVPEYSREYTLLKLEENKKLSKDDVMPIAIGQMKLENELVKKANEVLICDTNLLETMVYSKVYYPSFCNQELEKFAVLNSYNLYFLTYIDTPWKADDLRDKPNERESIFLAFEETLLKNRIPFVLLKGNEKERFNFAVSYIDNLLR